MDGEPYRLEWQQMSMGGVLHDRWVARITSPHLSVEFATIGWAELRDLWVLRFMPAGTGVRCPIFYGDYRTKEKAMAHVERWALHHWRRVPVWVHPQRWGLG